MPHRQKEHPMCRHRIEW